MSIAETLAPSSYFKLLQLFKSRPGSDLEGSPSNQVSHLNIFGDVFWAWLMHINVEGPEIAPQLNDRSTEC